MLPLSEVSLYAATKEQTIASWKRTAVEWGTGLTSEEYVDREFLGEKQEFARGGKNVTWVLAPRSDPTTLDFLCSCETFKRKIAISGSGKEPVLEQGFGYGIASVFTPPQNRGKGYGKHMMRLLHWVLAKEEYLSTQVFPEEWGTRPQRVPQAGNGSASALWSDVGPTFYTGCGMATGVERDGWLIRDPFSAVWNVHDMDLTEGKEGSEVTWLDEESARAVWEKDAVLIRSEVVQAAKSSGKARTHFSFLPNEGVAEFQWYRLHYHFSRHVPNPPQCCGVSQNGGEAFATWTCEYRPGLRKTLIVTRLRANEDAIEGLMVQILRYAKDIGLDEVETWNLAPNLEKALGRFKGTWVERDKHYPAIKWYGDESIEWLVNERFCWC